MWCSNNVGVVISLRFWRIACCRISQNPLTEPFEVLRRRAIFGGERTLRNADCLRQKNCTNSGDVILLSLVTLPDLRFSHARAWKA